MPSLRGGSSARSADRQQQEALAYTALLRIQYARCPLARAAASLGDPVVIAAVTRWHPPGRCSAVRRERQAAV